MSRSYREPWYIEGYGSPSKAFRKNQANRRIRRSKNIPNHKAYKKFYEQYDICDYKYKYDPNYNQPLWQVGRK